MPFRDYIYAGNRAKNDTSESNILGCYARMAHPELYRWWNMDEHYEETFVRYPSPILQFWSHAANGLDSPSDRDMKYPMGSTLGKTPREVFRNVMGE